jgi:hypothetical protein
MDKADPARIDFLARLIATIRSITLPAGLQTHPRYSGFVQEPSQVLAITVSAPVITKLFVLHLPNVQDLTVWAYGPLSPYELLQLLEAIRKDPIFQVEIPKDSQVRAIPPAPPTVGAVLERPMLEFLELVRARLLDPPGSGMRGVANYPPVYQEITLSEDYVTSTPDTLLNSWIEEDTQFLDRMHRQMGRTRPYTREESDAAIRAREQNMDWLGMFYFPPIRVGAPPDLTLKERILPGPNRFELGPVVLVEPLDSIRFLATHYGYFAVQSQDESQATRLLNDVCGALHLSGVPSFVVRPRELGRLQIDLSTNTFLQTGVPGTERSVGNKDNALNKFDQPVAITIEQIIMALRLAKRYDQDTRLPVYIPLFLDSFGRLRSKEWNYAFYSAWMVVETDVNLEWDAVIQSGLVSQASYAAKRQSGISDVSVRNLPQNMTRVSEAVWSMLTALRLIGRIDPTDHAEYDRLRLRRNDILHPNSPAIEADAQDCYAAAEKIIRSRIDALR